MINRQHLWAWAASRPDSPALILADTGVVLSYKDMMTGAYRYANFFGRLGLVPGDSAALFMKNQVQFPQVGWAVEISGLYLVAVGTQLNSADAAYVIDNSNAKVLITSRTNATNALALLEHISTDVKLFMSDGAVKPFLSLEGAGSGESSGPLAFVLLLYYLHTKDSATAVGRLERNVASGASAVPISLSAGRSRSRFGQTSRSPQREGTLPDRSPDLLRPQVIQSFSKRLLQAPLGARTPTGRFSAQRVRGPSLCALTHIRYRSVTCKPLFFNNRRYRAI